MKKVKLSEKKTVSPVPSNYVLTYNSSPITAGRVESKEIEIVDPYFDQNLCIERLYGEYKKHEQLIVAVDFDETVFPYKNKDARYDKVIDLLRDCHAFGFHIVIYTASSPDRYEFMKEYLEQYGIAISSINKNPIDLPYGNHGKIYYNILLCDRAGLRDAYYTLRTVVDRIKVENV